MTYVGRTANAQDLMGPPDDGVPDSRTRTAAPKPRSAADARQKPHLFLVLECDWPLASPLRFSLHQLDEVLIGRRRARGWSRLDGPSRQLHLHLEDTCLSMQHARLIHLDRHWVLEDTGSKNGTFVNGVKQEHVELADGDIIELGHTFLVFRTGVEREPDAPVCFDASSFEAAAPGLSTMLPPLSQAIGKLASVARSCSDIAVLLEGEPGTGKEVLAQAIHALSGRSRELVAVNCGALPRDLVEAELFGYRKGAFSGANEDRMGLVRAADRSTLFLDEIGDLPLNAQAKLLRVLEAREVRPLGDTRTSAVDFRLIAATNRPLKAMVEAGTFRQDLFGRLAGYHIHLPPLRERREDIGLLIGAILRRHADPEVVNSIQLHPQVARAMLNYAWPGNVRELEKALETALVLAGRRTMLDPSLLPQTLQRALDEASTTSRNEDAALLQRLTELLRQHSGNVAAVARAMGKERMQIWRWLKRFNIDPEDFRR